MAVVEVIVSQYLASLQMLEETVAKCAAALWDDPNDKVKFWHVAYHALFYTHLYLQDTVSTFTPWPKHRKDYQYIGRVPSQVVEPYDKDTVLEYLAFCRQQVVERVPATNLDAASGFDWLPFNKFELQIYTIRHIQQHAGELMERLGSRAAVEIDWVGHVDPLQKDPSSS